MKRELEYFRIGGSWGGNQSWFFDFMMRIGGCGAVTACDCCIYSVSYTHLIKSDLLGRRRNEGGAGATGLRSSEDSAFEEGNFTARTGKCGSRARRERVDPVSYTHLNSGGVLCYRKDQKALVRRLYGFSGNSDGCGAGGGFFRREEGGKTGSGCLCRNAGDGKSLCKEDGLSLIHIYLLISSF